MIGPTAFRRASARANPASTENRTEPAMVATPLGAADQATGCPVTSGATSATSTTHDVDQRFRTESSVKGYGTTILRKFDAGSRLQAVVRAHELGFKPA